jgi:hypothetical protein
MEIFGLDFAHIARAEFPHQPPISILNDPIDYAAVIAIPLAFRDKGSVFRNTFDGEVPEGELGLDNRPLFQKRILLISDI